MATLEIDPDFNIHTSYHNDLFLLRTRVLVNGENTAIRSVREGKYEGPVLNVCHSGSTVSTTLSSISKIVSPILVRCGLHHVDTFYYEQSPLFHVVFTSEACLKNFILAIGEVKSALELQLQLLFSHNLKTQLAQQVAVEVQPDLFLVSPNRQNTKGAEVHLVTAENCSIFVTRWKDSKLFDFGALYQEEAKPPKVTSQAISQKDAPPGKAVAFSVEATGRKPLNYQWQWKQFGKKHKWQNLSSECSTLQVEEVQASNAGYYRCVVSNSAGSATSQCATLTVAAELADLVSELQDVTDWKPFGLYLGIKMARLEAIKVDCSTLADRRIQLLNVWQKQVTPTWSTVVQALMGIGMRRLASELAQKHGTPLPEPPDDEHLEQLKDIPWKEEVCEEIQKLRSDLKQDRKKLVDTEERLRCSQESTAKANEKTIEIMTKLEKSYENVQKISQEKNNFEMKLKIKEHEYETLCAMQEKDNQVLQKKIEQKEEKIRRLKEELQTKDAQLQSALQDAQIQRQRLLQAQKKLKKKHEEVKKLKREKEKLACSYNEQVSQLVQMANVTTDKEEMKQQLDSMGNELNESQQIEVYNSDIKQFNGDIKALSSSLQEKEATATQLQSRQVTSTPEQLELLKLTTQIAELELKLQEAEYKKQQAESEREAAVQEMKARQNLKAQLHAQLDEPPKVTGHPKSLGNVSPGTAISFTVQATGTEPLNYQWQWAEEDGSHESCPGEWSDGAALTIPNVQKTNEGSYRCVISNCAGTLMSRPAQLSVADPPRVTSHPQQLKSTVPGKCVVFTVQATGTVPLSYQWEWKPTTKEGSGHEGWHLCNLERFPGADSSTLTIPSVQKSNEGSYRCVISNCAGTQTSNPAELGVDDPPRITIHPQGLKDAVHGEPVTFTVQAIGTEPLNYHWRWKPAAEVGSEEWQTCDAEWCDGVTLTIPSVQQFNEGSYRCVVSNCAGTQISKAAQLKVDDPPRITIHPQGLKDVVQGKPVTFTAQATGTQLLSYHWEWKTNPPRITTHPQEMKDAVPGKAVRFTTVATGTQPLRYRWEWKPPNEAAEESPENEAWQPCNVERFPGADSSTMTIPSVQKSNEGSYHCVVINCAGYQTSNPAELSVVEPLGITIHPRQLKIAGSQISKPAQLEGGYAQYHLYSGPGGYQTGSPQHQRMGGELFTVLEIRLMRQVSGFGFRIVGGKEERSQATVGGIVEGGAADLDGRLIVGDEITHINGVSVMDASHREVISLMGEAAVQGEVVLGIRRKMPLPESVPPLQGPPQQQETLVSGPPHGVREVTVERPNVQTSFGFVLQSNTLRPGSTICRLVPGSPAELCNQLYVYDELLAVNGQDVSQVYHGEIVNLIKSSGTSIHLTVQQPEDYHIPQISPNISDIASGSDDNEEIHHIDIQRDGQGFGFGIRGGAEYNAPLCVLRMAEGGTAKRDGRLKVGDELLEINGNNTEGMLYLDAMDIIKHGGSVVKLIVRREEPFIGYYHIPQISPNISDIASGSDDNEEIHHIDIQRDGQGFGFGIRGGAEYNAPLCVLRIAEGGAAERDSRLKVGDELLEINGNNTEGMLHSDAINIIKHGGSVVKLIVRREEPFIGYGTVDHWFLSGHSYPLSRQQLSSTLFTRAKVLYIGPVQLPESLSRRGPSSKCIQHCTRVLLSQQQDFFEVFLEVDVSKMRVMNVVRKLLFVYERDELYYSGVCTDDPQYFAIVTRKLDQKGHKKTAIQSDTECARMCHVFKVVQGKSVLMLSKSQQAEVKPTTIRITSCVTIINAVKGILSGEMTSVPGEQLKDSVMKNVVDLRPKTFSPSSSVIRRSHFSDSGR